MIFNQDIWEQLRTLIGKQIGFQIRSQDLIYFKPKVSMRMEQMGLTQISEYYDLLQQISSPISSQRRVAQKEWQMLANLVTNGESFFFRDRGQFNLLSTKILPQIIEKKRLEQATNKNVPLDLKIWSAGCSTGEEVYSLAMLINELVPDLDRWRISIIGTDINQDFLDRACQGVYKEWSFRQTDPSFKGKYFIRENNQWRVKPYLKSMVSFYQDNLLEVNKISHYTYGFDLVVCRNVFIYFGLLTIQKVIEKIENTLSHGGLLLTGHAELQGIDLSNFKTLTFSTSNIYQYQGKYLPGVNSDTKPELFLERKQTKFKDYEIVKQDSHDEISEDKLSDLSIESKLKEIEELLESSQYEQVIKQAEDLLENDDKSVKYNYLIAQSYFKQEDFFAAEKYCKLALELDSLAIDPLMLLAKISTFQEDDRQAKELYKRVIYLEPSNLYAYLELGSIYYLEEDYKRALKLYRNAENIIKSSSENQVAHAERQQLNYRINRLQKI